MPGMSAAVARFLLRRCFLRRSRPGKRPTAVPAAGQTVSFACSRVSLVIVRGASLHTNLHYIPSMGRGQLPGCIVSGENFAAAYATISAIESTHGMDYKMTTK